MRGIKIDNKHSHNDFGLILISKSIGIPGKNKITEKVPFCNEVYDFSGLYSSQIFDERKLEYTFSIKANNKIALNIEKIKGTEWLMSLSNKQELYDDDIPDFYFLAECEDISFSENNNTGILKCKFSAYPFKIAKLEEGNDIWDTFNFELDYVQATSFNVVGTLDTTIMNLGIIDVEPTIVTDSEFEVVKDNITYVFPIGTTKDNRFTFAKGENLLTLSGTGAISFKFKREVL